MICQCSKLNNRPCLMTWRHSGGSKIPTIPVGCFYLVDIYIYTVYYIIYIYIFGWKLENATTKLFTAWNLGPFSACHQLTSFTCLTHTRRMAQLGDTAARIHGLLCANPKKQAASGDPSATWAPWFGKVLPSANCASRTREFITWARFCGGHQWPSVSLAHPPDLVGGSSAASDATAVTKMSPILHRFQRASDVPKCSAEMGCKMGCQLRRTPCPIWDPLPNKTFSWFELVDIPDVKKQTNKQLLNQDQGWPKYMGQDKPLWASVPSF